MARTNVTKGQLYSDFTHGSLATKLAEHDAALDILAPIALDDVFIYVNGTSGDDANPGTASLPVATIEAAQRLIPAIWFKKCRIYTAAGNYTYSGHFNAGKPKGNGASPLIVIGGIVNILGNLTETAGSAGGTVFTHSGLSLNPHDYEGNFITCLTGDNAGQRKIIRESGTNSFEVCDPFFSAITIGDTFRVEKPSVNITGNFECTQTGGVQGFKDLKFIGGFGSNNGCRLFVEGVECDGGSVGASYGASLSAWSYTAPWAADGDDNPFDSNLRFTAGMYVHGGANFGGFKFAQIEGAFLFRNVSAGVGENCFLDLEGLDAKDSTLAINTGSSIWLTNNSALPGRMNNCPLTIDQSSSAQIIDSCVFTNCGDTAAITITNQSNALIGAVSGSSGNTGAGIALDYSARASINALLFGFIGGTTTVTGAVDSKFGHPTIAVTKSYTQLNTPDGSGVKGFSDNYFNRIDAA